MPSRIQGSHAKGWHMPRGAIYVGAPSRYRNPFRIGGWFRLGDPPGYRSSPFPMAWSEKAIWIPRHEREAPAQGYRHIASAAEAVEMFAQLAATGYFAHFLPALRGHDLCCSCRLDQPCHADVLLELANGDA